jgi:hypothetical protein
MILAAFPAVPGGNTEGDRPATRRRIRGFWWGQGTGLWVHPSFKQIELFGYELGDPNPNNTVNFAVRTWTGRIVDLESGEQIELVGNMCEPYRTWADLGPEFSDDQPLGPPPAEDRT